jgi:hypothetical protein
MKRYHCLSCHSSSVSSNETMGRFPRVISHRKRAIRTTTPTNCSKTISRKYTAKRFWQAVLSFARNAAATAETKVGFEIVIPTL